MAVTCKSLPAFELAIGKNKIRPSEINLTYPMKSYDTMVDAINDLKEWGYDYDFNLKLHCLECPALGLQMHPEDFEVDEVHRFEGMSTPDDNSVLYAVSSSYGGILVDAYGVYAENITEAMRTKLK